VSILYQALRKYENEQKSKQPASIVPEEARTAALALEQAQARAVEKLCAQQIPESVQVSSDTDTEKGLRTVETGLRAVETGLRAVETGLKPAAASSFSSQIFIWAGLVFVGCLLLVLSGYFLFARNSIQVTEPVRPEEQSSIQEKTASYEAGRMVEVSGNENVATRQNVSSEVATAATESVPVLPQARKKTTAAATAVNQSYEFKCTGIILDDNGNYCIINGAVLKKGQYINGAMVESITESDVLLSRAGQRIIVSTASK